MFSMWPGNSSFFLFMLSQTVVLIPSLNSIHLIPYESNCGRCGVLST
jgi:NADH:ubiquinone oxidoreductase subunit H